MRSSLRRHREPVLAKQAPGCRCVVDRKNVVHRPDSVSTTASNRSRGVPGGGAAARPETTRRPSAVRQVVGHLAALGRLVDLDRQADGSAGDRPVTTASAPRLAGRSVTGTSATRRASPAAGKGLPRPTGRPATQARMRGRAQGSATERCHAARRVGGSLERHRQHAAGSPPCRRTPPWRPGSWRRRPAGRRRSRRS